MANLDRPRMTTLDLGKAAGIVEQIEDADFDFDVSDKGLQVMSGISVQILFANNPEMFARMLDARVCECVVNILSLYGMQSPVISANACTIIKNLSFGSRDLAEHFASVGACEMVVFVAGIHVGEAEVADAAAGAIGMLARNNISHSYELAQAGACDILAQIGNFGFNIKHPLSVHVAGQVCYAYSQLAEASNASKLMEAGAIDLIISLMKFHLSHNADSTAVILPGIKALCCLASLSYECRTAIGNAKGCELLIECLNTLPATVGSGNSGTSTPVSIFASPARERSGTNSSVTVASNGTPTNGMSIDMKLVLQGSSMELDGCEAIMHLALCPMNADRLGQIGACAVIVNSLCHRLVNVPFGAEICSGALLNLITYGKQTKDNRIKLLEAGGVDQCRRMQLSPKASCRARDNIAQILEYLDVNAAGFAKSSSSLSLASTASTSSYADRTPEIFVGVVNACEGKNGVVPLAVELREYNEVVGSQTATAAPLLASETSISGAMYEI